MNDKVFLQTIHKYYNNCCLKPKIANISNNVPSMYMLL